MSLKGETAHGIGQRIDQEFAYELAGLCAEVTGRTDQHHSFDTIRLHRRHVKQRVASHADPDGFELVDLQCVEQCEGVVRGRAMRPRSRASGGMSMLWK